MIFYIIVAITILAFIIYKIFDHYSCETGCFISSLFAGISSAIAIVMLIILIIIHISMPYHEASWQEQYKTLTTRVENHLYYPWDRTSLIKEIDQWNQDLAARRNSQSNQWISIFYPESTEGLDLIDINSIT